MILANHHNSRLACGCMFRCATEKLPNATSVDDDQVAGVQLVFVSIHQATCSVATQAPNTWSRVDRIAEIHIWGPVLFPSDASSHLHAVHTWPLAIRYRVAPRCSLIRRWRELKQSFPTPYQLAPGNDTECQVWLTFDELEPGGMYTGSHMG